jgi:hypothetical protein
LEIAVFAHFDLYRLAFDLEAKRREVVRRLQNQRGVLA